MKMKMKQQQQLRKRRESSLRLHRSLIPSSYLLLSTTLSGRASFTAGPHSHYFNCNPPSSFHCKCNLIRDLEPGPFNKNHRPSRVEDLIERFSPICGTISPSKKQILLSKKIANHLWSSAASLQLITRMSWNRSLVRSFVRSRASASSPVSTPFFIDSLSTPAHHQVLGSTSPVCNSLLFINHHHHLSTEHRFIKLWTISNKIYFANLKYSLVRSGLVSLVLRLSCSTCSINKSRRLERLFICLQ